MIIFCAILRNKLQKMVERTQKNHLITQSMPIVVKQNNVNHFLHFFLDYNKLMCLYTYP